MKKIKVIIVDDERLARDEIKQALLSYPEIEVLGEAGNADDAKLLIEKNNPQLIFLDVQMPGASGFDLLEMLDNVPEVIFTTAFDQYAVKAFDTNALDYLVKPIREERFAKAMQKVKDRLSAEPVNQQIFIKDGNKCYFVYPADIYLIESLDNYAVLYFGSNKAFLKRSLNQLEDKLDPAMFFRINRAQIINTAFIAQVNRLPGGKLNIKLKTGQLLEVSDRQSVKFKTLNRL
ncbi:response regulator [Mucilaginibacter sp.]|uniref:LytR/AlgR family response regulator transcription factor n=1 Tax=Mucilaginibacter sp. TaxID=1882438 RepID=UPI0025EF2998|nr:response regulator [Mucilaginibacter sp.]